MPLRSIRSRVIARCGWWCGSGQGGWREAASLTPGNLLKCYGFSSTTRSLHAPRNLLAAAIAAAATAAIAADDSETLDTIFIKTQRGYSADATENSRDYSAFAATVGTKIPATPREIPQSISIVTNQQIKDRNVETLDQLARKTPGLRVLSNDDGRSSVYARGYEYDEYNVDGLPAQMQSINGTLPNLAAFDRVEVMRGPSGLFDSSGEMGSIVNLVRKRPGDSFAASVNAGYGTDK